jgi:hypothetical protein
LHQPFSWAHRRAFWMNLPKQHSGSSGWAEGTRINNLTSFLSFWTAKASFNSSSVLIWKQRNSEFRIFWKIFNKWYSNRS